MPTLLCRGQGHADMNHAHTASPDFLHASSIRDRDGGLDRGDHAHHRGLLHRVRRVVTYPALLGANAGAVGWAIATEASLESVTFVALLGSLVVLFALEWLVPHRRQWHPNAREVVRDAIYFGMNGALDVAVKMGLAVAVASIGAWNNGLSFLVGLPLAILVADFAGYWMHRFGHAGWLWKVHGVHHAPDKVNTWNNNTINFVNTLYGGLAKTLPLALLGFSADVVIVASFVLTLQSFAVHANIDVKLGWLGWLVMGPQHHRLHHSTVVSEAGNFASAVTLWDILFGTLVYGDDREPAEVGVEQPETFPAPTDLLRNQLHPFVDQGRA